MGGRSYAPSRACLRQRLGGLKPSLERLRFVVAQNLSSNQGGRSLGRWREDWSGADSYDALCRPVLPRCKIPGHTVLTTRKHRSRVVPMESTKNLKPEPTTTDPKDWAVNCLDCDRSFKVPVGGFWPSEPRCYECGSKRHFARTS